MASRRSLTFASGILVRRFHCSSLRSRRRKLRFSPARVSHLHRRECRSSHQARQWLECRKPRLRNLQAIRQPTTTP